MGWFGRRGREPDPQVRTFLTNHLFTDVPVLFTDDLLHLLLHLPCSSVSARTAAPSVKYNRGRCIWLAGLLHVGARPRFCVPATPRAHGVFLPVRFHRVVGAQQKRAHAIPLQLPREEELVEAASTTWSALAWVNVAAASCRTYASHSIGTVAWRARRWCSVHWEWRQPSAH